MTVLVRAAVGLGSNVGDRIGHLAAAVDTLRSDPGIESLLVSPYFETAPVGGPDQDDFVNAVVVFDTTHTPNQLLELAHRCEDAAGRVRSEHWGPRTLDVDVLAYGDLTDDAPTLTLPHPRALERAFVLIPWAEVDPAFVVAGRSVKEWAATVDDAGVRLIGGEVSR